MLLLRLALPYLLLALAVAGYLIYRARKTGRPILKPRRVLFSRANLDALLVPVLFGVFSVFFIRYDLKRFLDGIEPDVHLNNIVFYAVLFLTLLAKQLEGPSLRERGISSSRGLWRWEKIDSYRWESDAWLTFRIRHRNRLHRETWHLAPGQKKEINAILKDLAVKPGSKKKNR